MDGDVWRVFYGSGPRRMVAITATMISLCCLIPRKAVSFFAENSVESQFNLIGEIDPNAIEQKFDDLRRSVDASEHRFEEGKKFLESFLGDLRLQYGIDLSLKEAAQLVKENFHKFQISEEGQHSLLALIEVFLDENNKEDSEISMLGRETKIIGVGYLIKKGWDSLDTKKHKQKTNYTSCRRIANLDPTIELPANVYIGAVEMFSGVLVILLPFPGSQALGLYMIGDGGRRVFDGYVQANDEERLRTDFPNP